MIFDESFSVGEELLDFISEKDIEDKLKEFQEKTESKCTDLISKTKIVKNKHYGSCNMHYISHGLIQNAIDSLIIKLRSKKQYKPILTASLHLDHKKIIFTVEDNGAGIDKKVEPFLFKKQIDSSKSEGLIGGVGVCLKVSKQYYLDEINGTINYFNKGQNKGAIFWYEVPLE